MGGNIILGWGGGGPDMWGGAIIGGGGGPDIFTYNKTSCYNNVIIVFSAVAVVSVSYLPTTGTRVGKDNCTQKLLQCNGL